MFEGIRVMSRKTARDLLFKLTFETLFTEPEHSEAFEQLLQSSSFEEKDLSFIKENYPMILENKEEIETIISRNLSDRFSFDRLFKIDLAILMLATHELIFNKTNSVKVVVNEAVELAKKYSTDNSYSFINGVLANIIKNENVTD